MTYARLCTSDYTLQDILNSVLRLSIEYKEEPHYIISLIGQLMENMHFSNVLYICFLRPMQHGLMNLYYCDHNNNKHLSLIHI